MKNILIKLLQDLMVLFNIHRWKRMYGDNGGYYRLCTLTGVFQKYSRNLDRWVTVYQKPKLKPSVLGKIAGKDVIQWKVCED